jgi:hypothetical protein
MNEKELAHATYFFKSLSVKMDMDKVEKALGEMTYQQFTDDALSIQHNLHLIEMGEVYSRINDDSKVASEAKEIIDKAKCRLNIRLEKYR